MSVFYDSKLLCQGHNLDIVQFRLLFVDIIFRPWLMDERAVVRSQEVVGLEDFLPPAPSINHRIYPVT